jgi:hypothetical protein
MITYLTPNNAILSKMSTMPSTYQLAKGRIETASSMRAL